MKRIYIAGKYDDRDIVSCLSNIRKGIEMASLLINEGHAVFCPFADFLYAFTENGPKLDKEKYQANSMAWVEVSDALLVLPGWETSGGTRREIERAKSLGIPVFFDVEELMAHTGRRREEG